MPADLGLPSLDSSATDRTLLLHWGIHDHERGFRNLCHLANSLGKEKLNELCPLLGRLLPRCPDPDMGLNNLERYLATRDGQEQLPLLLEGRARTLETLLQLMSSSQFFSDLLTVHPTYLDMIRLPLRSSPSRSELVAQLQAEVDRAGDAAGALRAFRHFRQRQLLRIGTNDIIRERSLEEITLDISRVAETALEVAFQFAWRQLADRFGVPLTAAGTAARGVVLAFGKLGGRELNYSSDIDLMFIYSGEGSTCGARQRPLDNSEFFARLASEVVRVLSAYTEDGQAYRVDLRLRPEGQRGPLARSLASTLSYYDTLGRTWERQALIKVRPVAGDLRLGDEFLHQIGPFIWRKYLSYAEINEIKALKRRMEQKSRHEGVAGTEVKTGLGGIRDVEFTIQFLQLLNGGDLPAVRQHNTLRALQALEEVGCLTDQEYQILDCTYRFLRKTEHRLQLMFDLQTHRLPDGERERERLARSMGYEPVSTAAPARAAFLAAYREKTDLNRKILDHLLHEAFAAGDREAEPETDLFLAPDPEPERIQQVLGRYPFKDAARAYHNLNLLAQETVPFLSTRRCRHFLASIAPQLLRAVAETPDPDMALINLEKVSASLGGKAALWELFSFNPPTLRLYVDLCAWSQYLCEILINNPGMIDELLDSLVLNQPRTLAELQDELRQLCWRAQDPERILHSFQDKEVLRIGVRDILGKDNLQQTTAALTDVAETILCQVAVMAEDKVKHRYGVPLLGSGHRQQQECRYVLLGLGKLGGREMSYNSDLDLILVYEGDGMTAAPAGSGRFHQFQLVEHLLYFTELARHIIRDIGHLGECGRLYQVDFRLRPTGRSGSLTIPLHEFQRYYQSGTAQLWELQALTRARPVYGDPDFARAVMATLEQVVYQLEWQPQRADDIGRMRERVQAGGSQRDLKRGFGGLVDIEFLMQLFRLKYGRLLPACRATNTWAALRALHQAQLLSSEEFQLLWDSHQFLRLVESRLRIVHNLSLYELPEKPEDLEKLARRLDFAATATASASQVFLQELDRHLKATRELFVKLLEREKAALRD